jgi:hypothetical protein
MRRQVGIVFSVAIFAMISAEGQAFSQTPAVPANFRDLYSSMERNIDAFAQRVGSQSNDKNSSVAWSAELLTANCNRGRALLNPATRDGIRLELDSLQSLGVKAVTVCIGFPILYQPFYDFNGDPEDYPRFIKFYRELSADIHARGLKLIVESSVLFLGSYSRTSGFKLAEYYPTLNTRQFTDGRAQNIVVIAKEVRPDFLNLGSEPDTQARLSGNAVFDSPAGYGETIGYFLKQLHQAGVTGIQIGAGVGSWQRQGPDFVRALLATGIDYLDLHIYPANRDFLDRAITYAGMAHAAGKQVAISEAWLMKKRDSELGQSDDDAGSMVFARDRYSFWAPLDQKFLGALIQFSESNKLLYFSPFWSRYFWSYVDYDASAQGAPEAATVQQTNRAVVAAMQARRLSSTGEYYKNRIAAR